MAISKKRTELSWRRPIVVIAENLESAWLYRRRLLLVEGPNVVVITLPVALLRQRKDTNTVSRLPLKR
jgi:hypothetical protein